MPRTSKTSGNQAAPLPAQHNPAATHANLQQEKENHYQVRERAEAEENRPTRAQRCQPCAAGNPSQAREALKGPRKYGYRSQSDRNALFRGCRGARRETNRYKGSNEQTVIGQHHCTNYNYQQTRAEHTTDAGRRGGQPYRWATNAYSPYGGKRGKPPHRWNINYNRG